MVVIICGLYSEMEDTYGHVVLLPLILIWVTKIGLFNILKHGDGI
jgi:hypothetical protein